MTDPVILLGTQSNGETLPVQVNAFGQLVAEGLQGPEGQKGDKGDTGETGPPGPAGEGVPTPYGDEGSVLTIVNNTPTWAGGQPPGPPEIIWSDFLRVEGSDASFNPSYPPHNAFDGNTSSSCIARGTDKTVIFQPGQQLGTIQSLNLWTGGGSDVTYEFNFDGRTMQKSVTGNPFAFTRVTGVDWGIQSILTIRAIGNAGADITIQGIELNGDLLVDSTYYTMRQVDELAARVRQLELVMSSDIDPS